MEIANKSSKKSLVILRLPLFDDVKSFSTKAFSEEEGNKEGKWALKLAQKLAQNKTQIMFRLDHAKTDVKGKTTDFKHEQNQVINKESK